MLCSDIRTEMVEHEICLLTWALRHIWHVNNTVEDRLILTVNDEMDLLGLIFSQTI